MKHTSLDTPFDNFDRKKTHYLYRRHVLSFSVLLDIISQLFSPFFIVLCCVCVCVCGGWGGNVQVFKTYIACVGRHSSSQIYNCVFNFTTQMQDIIGVEIFKQWNFSEYRWWPE